MSISSWIINLDMNSEESCFFCIVLQAWWYCFAYNRRNPLSVSLILWKLLNDANYGRLIFPLPNRLFVLHRSDGNAYTFLHLLRWVVPFHSSPTQIITLRHLLLSTEFVTCDGLMLHLGDVIVNPPLSWRPKDRSLRGTDHDDQLGS